MAKSNKTEEGDAAVICPICAYDMYWSMAFSKWRCPRCGFVIWGRVPILDPDSMKL